MVVYCITLLYVLHCNERKERRLNKFIKKAQDNYDIAVNKILYNAPGISPLELVTKDTVLRLDQFFKNISQEVRKNCEF